MAALPLSPPGSYLGPCPGDCTHVDCAETRAMAATVCAFCPNPIGYGRGFYAHDGAGLVHAVCLETRTDHDRRERTP